MLHLWVVECQGPFETLKELLAPPQVLQTLDLEKPLILTRDPANKRHLHHKVKKRGRKKTVTEKDLAALH